MEASILFSRIKSSITQTGMHGFKRPVSSTRELEQVNWNFSEITASLRWKSNETPAQSDWRPRKTHSSSQKFQGD